MVFRHFSCQISNLKSPGGKRSCRNTDTVRINISGVSGDHGSSGWLCTVQLNIYFLRYLVWTLSSFSFLYFWNSVVVMSSETPSPSRTESSITSTSGHPSPSPLCLTAQPHRERHRSFLARSDLSVKTNPSKVASEEAPVDPNERNHCIHIDQRVSSPS